MWSLNLKQIMFTKLKEHTLKRKMKRITCFSAVAVILVNEVTPQGLVYAASNENKNQIINSNVEYNEDFSKASIKFMINDVDKEKYKLISITSDKDDMLIYDNNNVTEGSITDKAIYEVTENGDYSFTVSYAEKKIDEKEIEAKRDGTYDNEKTEEITDEINQSTENDSVENQEETEVPDTTLVQEEKIEKILVNVSDIKQIEEKNTTPNKTEINHDYHEVNKHIKPNNINVRRNINESVDLEDQFSHSGTKAIYGDHGSNTTVDSSYFNIEKGTLKLGKQNDQYNQQTIVLTSKYAIDYNRDFEIIGKANISLEPEGFAIAFHNSKNYDSKNSGGSLGFYRDDKDDQIARNNGIPSALVAEVDTFNNDSHGGLYGDRHTPGHFNEKHIAINETDSLGKVVSTESKYTDLSFLENGFVDFRVKWFSSENKLQMTIENQTISYTNRTIGEKLKSQDGYYSISSGLNYHFGGHENILEMISFKYLDVDPKILTTSEVKSGNKYAIPNETVTITHEIWNEKDSVRSFNVELALNKANILGHDGAIEVSDLKMDNLKMGDSLEDLHSVSDGTKFDTSTPLNVTYPAHRGKLFIRYDIKIPDLKNFGKLNKLDFEVALGKSGMSQINNSVVVDIKNVPALYTMKSGEEVNNVDIIRVSNASEVNKDLMWNELYAQMAGNSNTYNLKQETDEFTDMELKCTYFINDKIVKSYPEQIENGNVYSLMIQVTDKLDSRLTNTFKRAIIIEQDIIEKDDYYIYAEDLKPISETKLVTLTQDDFKNYVIKESKPKAFKVNTQTGDVEMKDVEVNLEGWLDSNKEPYKKPGIGTIVLYIADNHNVSKTINQEVTKNTWSYDTKDRTEENGASGFIVIPKGIEMKRGKGNDTGKLVGDANVYFADYSALDVEYNLFVDKMFDMSKKGNPSNKFKVETLGIGNVVENRLNLGVVDHTYIKNKPLKIKFMAPRTEVDKSKGRWEGKVNFYFERLK